MALYSDWKKEIEDKLRKARSSGERESIPSIIKRCPKCNHLTLEYNPDTGEIRCSNCGFRENLMMIR